MPSVVADTHAIIWYLEESARLSEPARSSLDQTLDTNSFIFVPSISLVEIIYLIERGKVQPQAL
jgi:PIN domain nuclease of toxin-antitoxin system